MTLQPGRSTAEPDGSSQGESGASLIPGRMLAASSFPPAIHSSWKMAVYSLERCAEQWYDQRHLRVGTWLPPEAPSIVQHREKVPPFEEFPIMKLKDFILQQAEDLKRRVSRQEEKALVNCCGR